jgi:hypothetical protein
MEVSTTDAIAYTEYLLASPIKLTSGYTDPGKGAKPPTKFQDPILPFRILAVATLTHMVTCRSRLEATVSGLMENTNTCHRMRY